MNIALRPVEPDDDPFLFRLYASTRSDELAYVPWTEEQKEAFLKMQFAAQSRHYREHYPDASFDIVLAEGEPMGRLYVARWPEEMRIADISLLPEHRNAGIGTSLLRQLVSEADASDKPISIQVERFNPALRLYERLGFREKEDKGYTSSWRDGPDSRRPSRRKNLRPAIMFVCAFVTLRVWTKVGSIGTKAMRDTCSITASTRRKSRRP